jgi:OOP family OmpA-OmpF porin
MNISTSQRVLVAAALTVALTGCSTAEKNKAPAPVPAPVVAPAPPPPPTYVIEDVNFAFDSDKLKPTASARLDTVSSALQKQPDIMYESVGFTDSVGSAEYNQGLSERRAMAVHTYLTGSGVDAAQLGYSGMGESNPVATNDTEEGRAKNRRVEVRPAK